MDAFLYVFAAIYAYWLMRTVTGVKIFHLLQVVLHNLMSGTRHVSERIHVTSDQEFHRMTLKQKQASKKYKYYSFINDLLFAFSLKQYNITVEGFTIALFLIDLVIVFLICFLLNSWGLGFLLLPLFFATMLAMLFLAAQVNYQKRKRDLLAAMDLLCSVISGGIIIAVETSIDMMDPGVRQPFSNFLRNVNVMTVALPDAIHILNDEIGSLYDDFCETVILYETVHAPGMESLFSIHVQNNAKAQSRDLQLRRTASELNKDFFFSCGAIGLFILYEVFIMKGGQEFFSSFLGEMVIILLLAFALIVFITIQYITAQPYIYTERKEKQ